MRVALIGLLRDSAYYENTQFSKIEKYTYLFWNEYLLRHHCRYKKLF